MQIYCFEHILLRYIWHDAEHKNGSVMRFADLKALYTERYNIKDYAKDPGVQTMLGLFEKADKLSDAAKQEFVEAFNYEFALNGKVYLGPKLRAGYKYPHLLAEAETVGIRVEIISDGT
jgi:hypothetical protein